MARNLDGGETKDEVIARYSETTEGLLDTLRYIAREFEKRGSIDDINMRHVYAAIDFAKGSEAGKRSDRC